MLLRSEAPTSLTANGRSALDRLDVRLVCDLRTLPERQTAATHWPGEPQVLALDDGIDLHGTRDDELRMIYGDDTGNAALELLTTWYADMYRVYESIVRRLFVALTDGCVPVVIHCSAGKDRTGFVTSLVLLALGATPETVETDYLLTDRFFGADRLGAAIRKLLGRDAPSAVIEALRVNARYLSASHAAAEVEFGSVDGYLRHVGVDDAARHRLRQALVIAGMDKKGI